MIERFRHHRTNLAFLLVGVVFGALLLPPVAAHVNDSIDHLWGGHVKNKVKGFADDRYPRFGGTLPKGESLVGSFYGIGDPGNPSVGASISFPVPLDFNPKVRVIEPGDQNPAGCKGNPPNPRANPGFLCIFVDAAGNTVQINAYSTENGIHGCGDPKESKECRHGVALFTSKQAPGNFAEIGGTYAVTGK